MQNGAAQDPKYRNYVIAAAVGGFLLPVAGLVGALLFWSRGDGGSARVVASASIAGILIYAAVFALF